MVWKKYLPTLTFTFPTLTFTFPTLAFKWYQIRFKKPFVRRLPKLLRTRLKRWWFHIFLVNWNCELDSRKFDIYEQSVNFFLNIIFFPLWSHFLRNFWEASKNKTHGMILILTLARGNGCGQIRGHSTILGQRGRCLRSFLNSCWCVVAGDGWQMTPGPKIPKNVSLLFWVVLWIAYKIHWNIFLFGNLKESSWIS